jgi:hypothetical protein
MTMVGAATSGPREFLTMGEKKRGIAFDAKYVFG